MITISSKAGQRLAKAEDACQQISEAPAETYGIDETAAAYIEWDQAAKALAIELRENSHHTAEGD